MNALPPDPSASRTRSLAELWLQPLVVFSLLFGCYLVLRPFMTAILFAIVIAVSTWPSYQWLWRRLGHRSTLASLLSCTLVVLVIMAPSALLTASLVDAVVWVAGQVQQGLQRGGVQTPPEWMLRIPRVGVHIADYWQRLFTDEGELLAAVKQVLAPVRGVALSAGRALGSGLFQIVLSIFLLFFIYRDGSRLRDMVVATARHVGGHGSIQLLETAQQTVVGVMIGAIGTALAQSMVAMLGFAVAGVPGAFVLGALTFVLSLVPVGPPLIWIGASIWLFREGDTGWGIFMLVYGFFGISSIDNLIKPLLISRTTRLSFAMTLLGVMGGVLAFGFMGVFIGPTLLAVVASLAGSWVERNAAQSADTA